MIKPEGYQPLPHFIEVLKQAKISGRVLEAVVTRVTYIDSAPVWEIGFPGMEGVRGLVPENEMGVPNYMVNRMVGQVVRVKVKGLDKETGLVACSRREAVAEAAAKLLAQLKEGQVLECLVKAVLPPGEGKPARLVVDAGGGYLVEIPRREAQVAESVPLSALYRPGQVVRAAVVRLNPHSGILELSIRAAGPDPWETAPEYRRGDFLAGRVVLVGKTKEGHSLVFVEAEGSPGVVGIAPAPLLGALHRGDRVSCVVTSFNREQKKLHLRIRGLLA